MEALGHGWPLWGLGNPEIPWLVMMKCEQFQGDTPEIFSDRPKFRDHANYQMTIGRQLGQLGLIHVPPMPQMGLSENGVYPQE